MAKRPPAQKPASDGTTTPDRPKPSFVESDLTPRFKLIFWVVFSLTVLSLAVSTGLTLAGPDTEEAKRLIETCSTTWKLGFGAIIGMVTGKNL